MIHFPTRRRVTYRYISCLQSSALRLMLSTASVRNTYFIIVHTVIVEGNWNNLKEVAD